MRLIVGMELGLVSPSHLFILICFLSLVVSVHSFPSFISNKHDCGPCCLRKSTDVAIHLHSSLDLRPNSHASKKHHRIKYVKTHKTGSSTLGSILFRFGARHNFTFYKSPTHGLRIDAPKNKETLPADIVLYHFAGKAKNLKQFQEWEDAYNWYNEVVPGGKFVTIVRDPISHFLSSVTFYNVASGGTLEKVVEDKLVTNILVRDFAVRTEEDMEKFMNEYADKLDIILVANRMKESLIVLAHELNWSLWDLTHLSLLDSSQRGFTRWDGKSVQQTPKEEDLDPKLVDKIKELTQLDKIFYDYSNKRLDAVIKRIGPDFHVLMDQFEQLNTSLQELCECNDLGAAELPFCQWYDLSDIKYERTISDSGHATPVSINYLEDIIERNWTDQ